MTQATAYSDEDMGLPGEGGGSPNSVASSGAGLTDEDMGITSYRQPTGSGMASQFLSGVQKGLYSIPEAAYNAPAFVENQAIRAGNRMFGTNIPEARYADIGASAGRIDPRFNPAANPPQSFPERIARGAGMGAGFVASGPLVGGAAAASGFPRLAGIIGESAPTTSTLTSGAAAGAGSTVGGEMAPNLAPENYPRARSLLGSVGSLVGGVGAGALAGAPAALGVANPERQAMINAGAQIGALPPRYLVGSPVTQATGELLHSIPVAGVPIDTGTKRFLGQLGSASEATSGNLGAGEVLPSGQAMQRGLKGWIGPVSRGNVSNAYGQVDNLIQNPDALTPLASTNARLAPMIARREAYGDSPTGKALDLIANANTKGQQVYFDRQGGTAILQAGSRH